MSLASNDSMPTITIFACLHIISSNHIGSTQGLPNSRQFCVSSFNRQEFRWLCPNPYRRPLAPSRLFHFLVRTCSKSVLRSNFLRDHYPRGATGSRPITIAKKPSPKRTISVLFQKTAKPAIGTINFIGQEPFQSESLLKTASYILCAT